MLSPFLFETPSYNPGSVSATSGVMVDGMPPFHSFGPAGTSVMARAFPFAGPSTMPSSSGIHHSSDPSTDSPPRPPTSQFRFGDPFSSFDNFNLPIHVSMSEQRGSMIPQKRRFRRPCVECRRSVSLTSHYSLIQ
jgi:hypothetical protein